MTYYHGVFEDECGGEFGAGVEAASKEEARERLEEDYPESRLVQLEGPEDTQAREARIYADALSGVDYDEDGRPFYPHGYEYDDEDDDGDY